jgi:hypothetical protein
MTAEMKLLFATSIVPARNPASGYEIANRAILDGLRRAGADVTVIGFAWPGQEIDETYRTMVLGEIELRTDAAPLADRLTWLARAIGSGTTFSSAKLLRVSAETVRERLAAAGPFDGVILNSVQFAGAFEEVFEDWPCIYVAHNVEHRSARENAASLSGYQAALYRREARLLEAIERRLCERSRFVFTLSEEDRAQLALDERRSAHLPLVSRREAPPCRPRRPEFDVGIIGTWSWRPNMIGLEWFLDEVVPLLPDQLDMRIAGHAPADTGSNHRGIRFVGRVADAADFLRQARIVPLFSRAGTGVQLKTIETFELGLPAVATSLSLRGIDTLPENCVVADDPESFARALLAGIRQPLPDVDGSGFHAAQRAALDTAMARGLATLGDQRRIAA